MKTPQFKYSVKVKIALTKEEITAICRNASIYSGMLAEAKPVLDKLDKGSALLDHKELDVLIQATTDWADIGRADTTAYLHKRFRATHQALIAEHYRANNEIDLNRLG